MKTKLIANKQHTPDTYYADLIRREWTPEHAKNMVKQMFFWTEEQHLMLKVLQEQQTDAIKKLSDYRDSCNQVIWEPTL